MIEVLQPGHFVAAAAGLGVVYAVYRIAKSNREIRKNVKDLDNRVEPKLGSLAAQVSSETVSRQMSEHVLSQRINHLEAAERQRKYPPVDAVGRTAEQRDRVSKPFGGFPEGVAEPARKPTGASGNVTASHATNRQRSSSGSETPLSSPLHPANPLNPVYADDTPSRSSSSAHDSGCSSRSSSSYSGGSSSSGSYDSGSSSSDSGSCSSSD